MLDSVQHESNEVVYDVFISRIGLACSAVGYDHARCGGTMSHQLCQTSKSRTLHFEVGNVHTLILETLYLLVLMRIYERHAQLPALRSEEATTGYGYASYHIVLGDALHQILISLDDVGIRLAHIAVLAEVTDKGAFHLKVADGVSTLIEVEQTVEAYRVFRADEGAFGSVELQSATRSDTYNLEAA